MILAVPGIGQAQRVAQNGTKEIGTKENGAKAVTCTNPSSGASWQISIDYAHGTVDTVPASISDAEISWHTADGQNFRLNRKSGDLTVVLASSTGGAFIYDRCNLSE